MLSDHLAVHSRPEHRRPPRAELVARVRALLPDVPAGSPRFTTALLYLASRWTPNVDRLALLVRCERELVARCARRWADQELWNSEDPHAPVDQLGLTRAVEVGEGREPRVVLGANACSGQCPASDALPTTNGGAAQDADDLLAALWERVCRSDLSPDGTAA